MENVALRRIEDEDSLLNDVKSGLTQNQLAIKYNVSIRTIANYIKRFKIQGRLSERYSVETNLENDGSRSMLKRAIRYANKEDKIVIQAILDQYVEDNNKNVRLFTDEIDEVVFG